MFGRTNKSSIFVRQTTINTDTMKNEIAQSVKKGQLVRKRLVKVVERAITSSTDAAYPHTYIYSAPGLGKTHTVNNFLKNNDVLYFELSGAVSLFAFGVSLATIRYNYPNEKVVISVDDCDGIFKTEENINIMKNVLSGARMFSYQKSLQSLIGNLSPLQKEAVESFGSDERLGFQVPCEDFTFIFTSNFRLPTDDEVIVAREKGGNANVRKVHLNAIRSRCKTMDFELDKDTHFGWLADVLLNETISPEVSLAHKEEMLNFVYSNWSKMTERSIRTLEKMAQSIVDEPEDYKMIWEIDYLK
jgi:hypothetical protein